MNTYKRPYHATKDILTACTLAYHEPGSGGVDRFHKPNLKAGARGKRYSQINHRVLRKMGEHQ